MLQSSVLLVVTTTAAVAWVSEAHAAWWEDVTEATIGVTAEWSNKVELADIDGDGRVDILLANGRGYASDGGPELNRVFLNRDGEPYLEVSAEVMGEPDRTRVIKARDADGDGLVDLFIGNTWQTQSRLLLGDGIGGFEDVTATNLPAVLASLGDAEFGDVDGDGDLDLVLADWGAGNPAMNAGGRVLLWLNDGNGVFTDATDQVPDVLVRWSWELELIDVDGNLDLDILVSCKSCTGSFLFLGDGTGQFTDDTNLVPQYPNNYDFEAMDLTGDGNLEVLTINDNAPGSRNRVFSWQPGYGFVDVTDDLLPLDQNLAGDDNMIAFVDADNDGDPDVLVGGLFGSLDRVLINDGTGKLSVKTDAFNPADSLGTLGMAVADLNGDHRSDVVMAEGEGAEPDLVFFGEDIPVDSVAPQIIDYGDTPAATPGAFVIVARVHDMISPVMPHQFQEIVVEQVAGDDSEKIAMTWYGDALWRAEVTPLAGGAQAQVCATDAAGNQACSPLRPLGEDQGSETDSETTSDTEDPSDTDTPAPTESGSETASPTETAGLTDDVPTGGGDSSGDSSGGQATDVDLDDDSGCGCRTNGRGGSLLAVVVVAGLLRRKRRPA